MNIACDVTINHKTINLLELDGYKMVVKAKNAEKDIDWVNRGFNCNAIFFISADKDIGNILKFRTIEKWIRMPGNLKGMDYIKYIIEKYGNI